MISDNITLDVHFIKNSEIGTACLIENLITDNVVLELSPKLLLGETKYFVNKAVEILSKRYKKINVVTHWNSLDEEEN